jgi:hypothetical protein
VQANHQINLNTREQATHEQTDNWDQEYLWFY